MDLNDMQKLKNIIKALGIGILILTIVLITVIIILFGKQNNIQKEISKNNQTYLDQFNSLNSKTSVENNLLKMGPQGTQGPQGPQGPPGGTFMASGPIMSMASKKVVTPTFGVNIQAIAYLDDKQYSPIQYWYLENNPNGTVQIKNKFTQKCLNTNNLGDVFNDNCNNQQSQQFMWGQNMQLASVGQQGKCITTDSFTRNDSNSTNSYNLSNLTVQNNSNTGTVSRLKLAPCSSSLNPNQTWYVGH